MRSICLTLLLSFFPFTSVETCTSKEPTEQEEASFIRGNHYSFIASETRLLAVLIDDIFFFVCFRLVLEKAPKMQEKNKISALWAVMSCSILVWKLISPANWILLEVRDGYGYKVPRWKKVVHDIFPSISLGFALLAKAVPVGRWHSLFFCADLIFQILWWLDLLFMLFRQTAQSLLGQVLGIYHYSKIAIGMEIRRRMQQKLREFCD